MGKIIGNMIGNDGNRMGNTQRFTKFFWVLVSSRSGNNKKKSGVTKVIMGNGKRKSVYKNDLM